MFSFLGIVENLIEFRPEVAQLAAEQGLMPWLLKRLKVRRKERHFACTMHLLLFGRQLEEHLMPTSCMLVKS